MKGAAAGAVAITLIIVALGLTKYSQPRSSTTSAASPSVEAKPIEPLPPAENPTAPSVKPQPQQELSDRKVGSSSSSAVAIPPPTCAKYRLAPWSCPDEPRYIPYLHEELGPGHKDWIFIDVGLNKGYIVSELAAAVGEELSRTPAKRRDAAAAYLRDVVKMNIDALPWDRKQAWSDEMCGACKDCQHSLPNGKKVEGSTVTVYGYDPVKPTVEFNRLFWSNPPPEPNVKLHFEWAAVSAETNKNDTSKQPRICQVFARETSKIGESPHGLDRPGEPPCNFAPVPVVALDDVVEPLVDHVDMLVTDTEGHDYFVAQGAKKLLSSGKVSLYIFELQADKGLKEHATFLEQAGYFCFFPDPYSGKHTEFTGACWLDDYLNWHGWTNAICVHRKHPKTLAKLREP